MHFHPAGAHVKIIFNSIRVDSRGLPGIKMRRYVHPTNYVQEGLYFVIRNLPPEFYENFKSYTQEIESKYSFTCTTAACATLRDLNITPRIRYQILPTQLLKALIGKASKSDGSVETFYIGRNLSADEEIIKQKQREWTMRGLLIGSSSIAYVAAQFYTILGILN